MIFLELNNSEITNVRIIDRDNEPWFVGRDICSYFGDSNHSRTLSRVADEDKEYAEIEDSLGRKQQTIIVNESGLYSILFSMQPQKANNDGVSDAYPIEIKERIEKINKFKHWVTSEVLPSIRRTGKYEIQTPKTYLEALKALVAAEEEKQILALENAEMKPKAEFADAIVASTTTIYVGEFAKILKQNGIETGQNRFFKQLVEDHLLLKRNGQYEPTQYAMKLKLFEIDSKPVRIGDETQIKRTVKVTPQGQKYLINKYLGEREEISNDRHSEKFNTIYGNNETLSRSCI